MEVKKMNANQNQVNSMEEFVRRYGHVSLGGRALGNRNQLTLSACVERSSGDIGAQAREDFFRIHDGFERANSLYQSFQRAYFPINGALEPEQVRNLYAILEEMRETGIGDIVGIFRPLEMAEADVHRRLSRPLQASAVPYFMFPEEVSETYRNRLLPIFSQLPRVDWEEQYEVSEVPEEYLWNLHVQPREFFERLNGVLQLESMASYVNDTITAYEYAEAWNCEQQYEEHVVESLFSEGAAEELRQRNQEMTIVVVVPSLQSFRRSLPAELRSAEMFNLHALGDLRQSLQHLSTTNLFESYRTEALNNGWLRNLTDVSVGK